MMANLVRHKHALQKTVKIIESAMAGKSRGLSNDCLLVGLDIRKFKKHLVEYPELKDRWNGIDWVSLYKPSCAQCFNLLTKHNYRYFDSMNSMNAFVLSKRRFCDTCFKKHNKERFYTLEGKLASLWRSAKSRNKALFNNDLDFNPEYLRLLWDKQKGRCYYSGRILSYRAHDPNVASLDRIDSSICYAKDNIVITSWEVNNMKSNMDIATFVSLCKDISSYTSQECEKCGNIHKENRCGEVFRCRSCGYETDADFNASRNILSRFLLQEHTGPVQKSSSLSGG